MCAWSAVGASDGWVEVRSPRFVVVTDGGGRHAMRLARLAEQMRSVMASNLRRADAVSAVVRILAVRNGRDFVQLLPEYEGPSGRLSVGGASFHGPYGSEIVMYLRVPGVSSEAVLFHELSHTFSATALPALPRWLSEGLAQFWSTAKVRRDGVLLGLPKKSNVVLLERRGLLPIETLLTREDALGSEHLAAQAWLLTHWLILGEEGDEWARFDRYVEEQSKAGEASTARWSATADSPAVDRLLRLYLDKAEFRLLLVERPPEPGSESFARRDLDATEVDAILGAFLVHRSRPEAALPYLERALATDPELTIALAALGHLHFAAGDYQPSLALFSQAMATGEASDLVYERTVAAVLRVDLSQLETSQLQSYLRQVVSDQPQFAPAWIQLAERYAKAGELDRAVSSCARAVESRPQSPWFRFLLARALRAAGRHEDARGTMGEATSLAVAGTDTVDSNNLCWYGGVGGFAAIVPPACEHAVRLRPGRGLYRGSRGVVRALNGDLAGAAEDLRLFLASADADIPGLRSSRQNWLEILEDGENPFDEKTLQALTADLPF